MILSSASAEFVFVILSGRALGHGGEDLDRDIALAQAREIDLAPVAPFGQIALPQQRVGMPVADHQPVMQGLRLGRDGIGRMRHHGVAPGPDIGGHEGPEREDGHGGKRGEAKDDAGDPDKQAIHGNLSFS